MKDNILKTLSNNWVYKLAAVIFAFILWLTVYNLEDPTKTVAFTINVTIANEEYASNIGKYFEVEDSSKRVSFSVTASRSVLEKLDASDFVAVADMNYLTIDSDGIKGSVPIEIACTENLGNNSIKLTSTNKTMKVRIEELMTKQFVVTARATGKVADGYALGSIVVTAPNVLKVSGPKSIVENINSAVAVVNVDGMRVTDSTYQVTPILLDKNGREIDSAKLDKDITHVYVATQILNTKEVALHVNTSGSPANGYVVTTISSSPTTIQLKGNKEVLNGISSINIPSDLVSVSGAKENISTTIDITPYLPEGVELVNEEDAVVEITIGIGEIKQTTVTINTSDLSVIGLPTGWTTEYALSSVAVTVKGLEEDIDMLDGAAIGCIDVTNLSAGTHQVELTLIVDDDLTYQKVMVTVTLKEPESTQE